MKLDKSPFVIISVIGQELLAQVIKISLTAGLTTLAIQAKYNAAVMVLESALKIGTCSLKLRGSVFSALSSAYWALNSLDKVKLILTYFYHILEYHCCSTPTICFNIMLAITGDWL